MCLCSYEIGGGEDLALGRRLAWRCFGLGDSQSLEGRSSDCRAATNARKQFGSLFCSPKGSRIPEMLRDSRERCPAWCVEAVCCRTHDMRRTAVAGVNPGAINGRGRSERRSGRWSASSRRCDRGCSRVRRRSVEPGRRFLRIGGGACGSKRLTQILRESKNSQRRTNRLCPGCPRCRAE